MESKKCGRCGEEKLASEFNKDKYTKTGLRSQCKVCMKKERLRLKDHYKEWRTQDHIKAMYRRYRKEKYNAKKVRARNAARKLTKMPCEICGCKQVEGHHDDYNKPHSVRWLCAAHHREWHDKNGPGLNG